MSLPACNLDEVVTVVRPLCTLDPTLGSQGMDDDARTSVLAGNAGDSGGRLMLCVKQTARRTEVEMRQVVENPRSTGRSRNGTVHVPLKRLK